MADLALRAADDTVELSLVQPPVANNVYAAPPSNAPPRQLPPMGAAFVVGLWSCAAVSLLCLWLVVSALGLGGLQYRAEQGRLYDTLREQLANGTAPLGSSKIGVPVALLQSPQAGLDDVVVVEGTSSGQTQRGPGHRRNTVLPGQPGVSVLFGRASTYGAAFGGITRLSPGDSISATTAQGTFVYLVEGTRRAGDPLPLPLSSGGGRLTLVTADAGSWHDGFAAHEGVYVDAALQGQAQPGAGRAAGIPESEQLMKGDTGAALLLLLWMQALLVVGAALAWAQGRWGRWQSWLVGAPVLLLVLWSATTAAVQLLPNVL